jgi:hypothetical protein
MKGRRENKSFVGVVPVRGGRHKERGNKDIDDGCVLYMHMKEE